MKPKVLIHAHADLVGVATDDISKDEDVIGRFMDDLKEVKVHCNEGIPLGHKIALRDMKKEEKVIEYGEVIGVTTSAIKAGDRVHIHNLKTLRW